MFKFITIAIFLILPVYSNAQIDNLSMDSIKNLLCHKWEYKAVTIAGQEMIVNIEDAPVYQFFNDYTLESVSKKKTEKGNWSFDSTKKLILVKTQKELVYIKRLTIEELFLSTDEEAGLLNNAEVVYKKIK